MRLSIRMLCVLAIAFAFPAAAQRDTGQPVDLALVLAVDASGSVDQFRFELQKQGYVAAFRHPRVIGAIQSGPTQSVAVIMMQWTGPALQVTAVPWTKISDAASASAFADKIAAAPRALFGGGTSIYETSPLQKRFRDVHAATQHMLIGPSTWELTGRLMLGLPTDIAQL